MTATTHAPAANGTPVAMPAPGPTTSLYRQPVPVSREQHAATRVAPITDWRIVQGLNAVPVSTVEFAEVARELPIAFVATGRDEQGRPQVTPVVLMGLRDGENLCVAPDGRWLGTYVPASLRRYPFAYAMSADQQVGLVADAAWEGFGGETGERLFDDAGAPSAYLQSMLQFLDQFEREMLRTRALCDRLVAHDLLRGGEIRGQLPDGRSVNAGGFFMIDEDKLAKLADEAVLELHRSGLMGLIHAHRVSMGHVQTLARRLGELPAG